MNNKAFRTVANYREWRNASGLTATIQFQGITTVRKQPRVVVKNSPWNYRASVPETQVVTPHRISQWLTAARRLSEATKPFVDEHGVPVLSLNREWRKAVRRTRTQLGCIVSTLEKAAKALPAPR
jgi:hypothetical protein